MRPETTALLVLYVVDPTKLDDNALDANSANEKKKKISVCAAGELLPIGFAIALPSSNKVKLPDYVVNSVLVDELEQEFSKVDELEGA
jgi:butyrate kinase